MQDIDIDKIDTSREASRVVARSWQQLTPEQTDRLIGLIDDSDDASYVLTHATQPLTPEQTKRLKTIAGV